MTVRSTPIDQEALAISVPFVNRFQITKVNETFVRISFAEALGSSRRNYRAAVIMSAADAKEIALSILNVLGTDSTRPS